MAVYKTRWFDGWVRKEGLASSSLCAVMQEMVQDLVDADLGDGYRTLVATNKGNRWVFVSGYSKNQRSNIDKDEVEALKKLAAHPLSHTAQAVTKAKRAGELSAAGRAAAA